MTEASVLSSQRATRAQIAEFLQHHRLAMVGASRSARDFSRILMRELEGRGYEVVPVNPSAVEVGERACFARVQDVEPPVEAVLVMTPAAASEQVVADCIEAGVSRVWLYRAVGSGAVSAAAVARAQKAGLELIAGECPFMFLPQTGVPHRFHGFVKKVFHTYPQ